MKLTELKNILNEGYNEINNYADKIANEILKCIEKEGLDKTSSLFTEVFSLLNNEHNLSKEQLEKVQKGINEGFWIVK